MSDTWLRAEPLWFGVHLAPEHGFLPETKKAAKEAAQRAADRIGDSAEDDSTGADGKNGRKRRRSVSAERRRRALERGRRKPEDEE